MVPINIQYWYKPKVAKGEPELKEGAAVNYVTKIMKDRLWESLIPHFTLPATETLELVLTQKEKVREWALKKMAAEFNNHKKRLWNAYVNTDRQALEFTDPNENLRDHWDAFLEYKESELDKLRSAKNKINVVKKKYHHMMGHRTRNRTLAQKVKILGTLAWGCLRRENREISPKEETNC
jgi:hypothetical protein